MVSWSQIAPSGEEFTTPLPAESSALHRPTWIVCGQMEGFGPAPGSQSLWSQVWVALRPQQPPGRVLLTEVCVSLSDGGV